MDSQIAVVRPGKATLCRSQPSTDELSARKAVLARVVLRLGGTLESPGREEGELKTTDGWVWLGRTRSTVVPKLGYILELSGGAFKSPNAQASPQTNDIFSGSGTQYCNQ